MNASADSGKTNPIKANTKPIQTQFAERPPDVQIDVNLVKTRNYNNEQRTMNYELLCKTNPIKPNFKGKKMLLWLCQTMGFKQFSWVGPEVRFILIRSVDTNQKSTFGYFNFKNFFFVRIQDIPCTLVLWRIEQFIEQ